MGKNISPLIVGVTAWLIVSQIVLPSYEETLKPMLVDKVPVSWQAWYDPTQDDTLNLQSLAALLAYIIMAGTCTVMDFVLPRSITLPLKVQGPKSYFSVKEWADAVAVSALNFFLFSWLGLLRGGSPAATTADEFSLAWAAVHTIVHINVIDVWFYSTHRLLHVQPIYTWIHKWHHRFKAPNAVCCTYANPIEFNLGNVMGVVLGPALTNCHPYTAAFWLAFSLASTAGSHSGYFFLGAEEHDAHHEHFHCNYGTGVFMDALFGTHYEGSALQKQVLARQGQGRDKVA